MIMDRFAILLENSKRAIRYWWLYGIVGLLLVAAGILTFAYPARSYMSLAVIFGWFILCSGILEIVLSATDKGFVTGRGWMIAAGIIEAVLGIILIFNVVLSAEVLPLFLGFWLMFRAFWAIGFGSDMWSLEVRGSGWTIFFGVLLLLCSMWIVFRPLVFGVPAVITWVGISLLLAGAGAMSFAWQLRGVHRYFDM